MGEINCCNQAITLVESCCVAVGTVWPPGNSDSLRPVLREIS
jgi:hypothetical protein